MEQLSNDLRLMTWIFFVIGAVLSWGTYGVILHKGQVQLGNPLRALLCVGVAYFLIGVLVPRHRVVDCRASSRVSTPTGTISATMGGRAWRAGRGVHHLGVPQRAGCPST